MSDMPRSDIGPSEARSAFVRKLSHFIALTPQDLNVIENLEVSQVHLAPGTEIVAPERTKHEVYILQKGWAIRHKSLPNGKRQVTNFFLPGDMIGTDAEFFCVPNFTVTCPAEVTVSAISTNDIVLAALRSPRLLLAATWCSLQEKSIICEHLLSVGRRSAEERAAHLLLELHQRLEIVGMSRDGTFELPITQETIGDALGLSVVHINRIVRQLREQRLVEISGHYIKHVQIRDFPGLKKLASFDDAFLCLKGLPNSLQTVIEERIAGFVSAQLRSKNRSNRQRQ